MQETLAGARRDAAAVGSQPWVTLAAVTRCWWEGAPGRGIAHLGPRWPWPRPAEPENLQRAPALPWSCTATNPPADPLQWRTGSHQRCRAFWPCSGADGRQSSSCPGKGTGNSRCRPRGSTFPLITGHLLSPRASTQTLLAPFVPRCLGMSPVCGGEQVPAACCSSQPPASTTGKAPSAAAMPGSVFGDKDCLTAPAHPLTFPFLKPEGTGSPTRS